MLIFHLVLNSEIRLWAFVRSASCACLLDQLCDRWWRFKLLRHHHTRHFIRLKWLITVRIHEWFLGCPCPLRTLLVNEDFLDVFSAARRSLNNSLLLLQQHTFHLYQVLMVPFRARRRPYLVCGWHPIAPSGQRSHILRRTVQLQIILFGGNFGQRSRSMVKHNLLLLLCACELWWRRRAHLMCCSSLQAFRLGRTATADHLGMCTTFTVPVNLLILRLLIVTAIDWRADKSNNYWVVFTAAAKDKVTWPLASIVKGRLLIKFFYIYLFLEFAHLLF